MKFLFLLSLFALAFILPPIIGIVFRIVSRIRYLSRRNIERRMDAMPMASIDTDAEPVERIRLQGPLRESRLRQIIRDKRLLPKGRRQRRLISGKPVKYFSASDAGRLFADTLRTTNREIRDLEADVAQLERYGLPVWKSEEDLADALGLTVAKLRSFSIHRDAERYCHYTTFAIAKRGGGERRIMAPKKQLKAVQRKLVELLVGKLPAHFAAHGFRRGSGSIATNAAPHVGRKIVAKMDIKDFFPSVNYRRVRGYLVALGYGYTVAATLAVLMTEAEREIVEIDGVIYHVPVSLRYCPQGAPTSPGLCNAILHRMDRRLSGLAGCHGAIYTRYADDLTFSCDDSSAMAWRLVQRAGRIMEEEGFEVNTAKTRLLHSGRRQHVTGVTVNDVAGLSKNERRLLRARIHHFVTRGEGDESSIKGMISYLAMLNPSQADSMRRYWDGIESQQ